MEQRTFDIKKVRGCMLGLAIGDALGMPVETASRKKILAATNGQGITGFTNIPMLTTIEDNRRLKIGDTTDDTQLAFVVAKSLIRKRGFDLFDMAQEHVEALRATTFGWGGTTRDAIHEIEVLFDSVGAEGQNPHATSGNFTSLGTGVAMKIAPLALFTFLRNVDEEMTWDYVYALGRMTHGHPQASLAAYAVLRMIHWSLVQQNVERMHLSSFKSWGPRIALNEMLQSHSAMNESLLLKEAGIETSESFVHKLQLLEESFYVKPLMFGDPTDPLPLLNLTGTGFSVMQAVPLAIGIAMRHPYDFRAAVCEAVNMGGDTDTIASMVGAIVGACVGENGIPQEFKEACHSSTEALGLANELFLASKFNSND